MGSVQAIAIRSGDPQKTIAQVALDTRAELIVLGAPRRRAFASLRGSTAERVVALARCSALIVRSKCAPRYTRVIVATDLKPAIKEILRFAERWSFLDSPRVSLVHGFQSPYQGPLYAEGVDVKAARRHIGDWKHRARQYLLTELNAAGIRGARFNIQIDERRPLPLVRQAIGQGASSLLILGGSKHNVFSRLARGSLVNDALRRLDCDVLIYSAT
jgi:nucleotide-binding universal stress UspA family protein